MTGWCWTATIRVAVWTPRVAFNASLVDPPLRAAAQDALLCDRAAAATRAKRHSTYIAATAEHGGRRRAAQLPPGLPSPFCILSNHQALHLPRGLHFLACATCSSGIPHFWFSTYPQPVLRTTARRAHSQRFILLLSLFFCLFPTERQHARLWDQQQPPPPSPPQPRRVWALATTQHSLAPQTGQFHLSRDVQPCGSAHYLVRPGTCLVDHSNLRVHLGKLPPHTHFGLPHTCMTACYGQFLYYARGGFTRDWRAGILRLRQHCVCRRKTFAFSGSDVICGQLYSYSGPWTFGARAENLMVLAFSSDCVALRYACAAYTGFYPPCGAWAGFTRRRARTGACVHRTPPSLPHICHTQNSPPFASHVQNSFSARRRAVGSHAPTPLHRGLPLLTIYHTSRALVFSGTDACHTGHTASP